MNFVVHVCAFVYVSVWMFTAGAHFEYVMTKELLTVRDNLLFMAVVVLCKAFWPLALALLVLRRVSILFRPKGKSL